MPKILGIDTSLFSKNYFINGDMRISQRGTSFSSIASGAYSLDRMVYYKTTSNTHTVTQDTDVPTVAQVKAATGVEYLFQNSMRLNLTSPDTSIAAGDSCRISQWIEGYNFANIAQKYFTISFWVKSSLAGVYCLGLGNGANDRSIVKEYTISSANTWEYKTILIPPSISSGTWNYINGRGLEVSWSLAGGSTFTTTPDSWQTGTFFVTSNQVNAVNTGVSDFRLTGVMINEGLVAAPFKLFGDDFEGELAACQRYYEKTYNVDVTPGTGSTPGFQAIVTSGSVANSQGIGPNIYKVKKRANATITIYGFNGGSGRISNQSGVDQAANSGNVGGFAANSGHTGFIADNNSGGAVSTAVAIYHFTADAEL